MKIRKVVIISIAAFIILLLASLVASADDRINQSHHFGGDTLYCDTTVGCWMTNSSGTILWEVSQTTLDGVMALACETGMSEVIEAGIGTFGTFWLDVSCYEGFDPSFTLVGTDEHGKTNRMQFSPDYTPVYSAPIVTPTPEPTVVPIVAPVGAL